MRPAKKAEGAFKKPPAAAKPNATPKAAHKETFTEPTASGARIKIGTPL